ncbi:MAG: hypothetical protein ACRDQ5_20920 [Sciscionella sp.]
MSMLWRISSVHSVRTAPADRATGGGDQVVLCAFLTGDGVIVGRVLVVVRLGR